MPNKAHQGAYMKGFNAHGEGVPRTKCPYNSRGQGGRFGNIPTGARGFANAWLRGWDDAEKEKVSAS